MSSLKTIDRLPFESLLALGSGYVLDFTNQSFAVFINESVGRNIYADSYAKYGDSKGKRLLALLELEADSLVGKVLNELLDIWSLQNPQPSVEQNTILKKCRTIVSRLLGKPQTVEVTQDDFLRHEFKDISIAKVPIDPSLIPILEARFSEARVCIESQAPLAAIFMCGSILEGLLLGIASSNPKEFNQATGSPKDKAGGVKAFHEWSLSQFIEVSCEIGFLKLDVKKFSHVLRDFRNYIHPYQQMTSRFSPDKHTAAICMQVLRAAIANLSGARVP